MAKARTREVGRAQRHTSAAPDEVWQRWEDHETWPQWVTRCRDVSMSSPMRCNATGRKERTDGGREDFVITLFVPGHSYAQATRLLGARVESRYQVRSAGGGSDVTVSVTLRGRLARLYRRRLTERLATSLPAELSRLTELAERRAQVTAPTPLADRPGVGLELGAVRSTGA
ncbi:SRPBCC family protein [Nocardioidaceae bacterium]|nr:SRPBCC family protein [Nocardioidaceae bacterium]